MSVGGWIIEIRPMAILGSEVVRLWTVDRNGDETCVYVLPAPVMPVLQQEIWWQGGKVYFDRDTKHLAKVGNSFKAPIA